MGRCSRTGLEQTEDGDDDNQTADNNNEENQPNEAAAGLDCVEANSEEDGHTKNCWKADFFYQSLKQERTTCVIFQKQFYAKCEEYDDLKKTYEDAHGKGSVKKIKQTRERLKKAEEENGRLKEELAELNKQTLEAKDNVKKLTSDLAELNEELERARQQAKQTDELRKNLENQVKEKDNLNKRLQKLIVDAGSKELKNSQRQALQFFERAYRDVSSTIDSKLKQINPMLQSAIDQLVNTPAVVDAKKLIDVIEAACQRCEESSHISNAITSLPASCETVDKVAQLVKENETLKSIGHKLNEDLKNQKTQAFQMKACYEKQLESFGQQVQDLNCKISSQEKELESLRAKNFELDLAVNTKDLKLKVLEKSVHPSPVKPKGRQSTPSKSTLTNSSEPSVKRSKTKKKKESRSPESFTKDLKSPASPEVGAPDAIIEPEAPLNAPDSSWPENTPATPKRKKASNKKRRQSAEETPKKLVEVTVVTGDT